MLPPMNTLFVTIKLVILPLILAVSVLAITISLAYSVLAICRLPLNTTLSVLDSLVLAQLLAAAPTDTV